jgi:hypothetical protein
LLYVKECTLISVEQHEFWLEVLGELIKEDSPCCRRAECTWTAPPAPTFGNDLDTLQVMLTLLDTQPLRSLLSLLISATMIVRKYQLCQGLFLGLLFTALNREAGTQALANAFSGLETHVFYQNPTSHQLLFSMSLSSGPLNQTLQAISLAVQQKSGTPLSATPDLDTFGDPFVRYSNYIY